ncbi:hypothetical protein KBP46_05535 [Chryseobacterium sp. PCH239]|uniref:hypothetical protein n=1 Tax=Chryseobacterium sp. PCH239 TaxID=2825845 RepID=UPI001C10E5A7|nr:hypothetical protein [Chryseobacterium sp. PCH239]QWT87320.1 hypothetical protein KBP46_05535 [Chryseobacterium sp. PCH239]
MITLIIILTFLIIIFLVNSVVIKSTQSKFPKNTEAQNLRLTEKFRQSVLIFGLATIFLSIIYVNFFYKSSLEISAEKEKQQELDRISARKLAEENEIKRLGLTKNEIEILNQHAITVKSLSDEVENAYYILKSKKYFVDTEIIRFTGLAKKTKGSKFEGKIEKTRDSLIKNENLIGKKQIADLDRKQAAEESQARLKYGKDLRNLLLDRSLDITVKVFGKGNKKMKLTYVLFNDVWFRKFETLGYFDMIHEKGFTHIELSDGYGYGRGMEYGK